MSELAEMISSAKAAGYKEGVNETILRQCNHDLSLKMALEMGKSMAYDEAIKIVKNTPSYVSIEFYPQTYIDAIRDRQDEIVEALEVKKNDLHSIS